MKKGCVCCFGLVALGFGLLIFIRILVSPNPDRDYLLSVAQTKRSRQIQSMLEEMKYVEPTFDGNAIMLLVDNSGSMKDPAGSGVERFTKIEVARQTAKRIFIAAAEYERANPNQSICLGLAGFGNDRVWGIVPLPRPPPPDYEQAIDGMHPNGNTPLGEAIINTYQVLQSTGYRGQHIVVITDGENTAGREPVDAIKVIRHLKKGMPLSVYFIAFDVSASAFDDEKNAGVWVAEARDAEDLNRALDFIFYQKILAEQPLP